MCRFLWAVIECSTGDFLLDNLYGVELKRCMQLETDLIIHIISRIRGKANAFIIAELEKHEMKGLVPVHGDILYALFRFEELSMKGIAEIVGRKKSTVTTLVDKLVFLGFVNKRKDEQDSRSFRISLTDKGRELSGKIRGISDRLISKVYKDMPMEERVRLMRSLRKIDDNW